MLTPYKSIEYNRNLAGLNTQRIVNITGLEAKPGPLDLDVESIENQTVRDVNSYFKFYGFPISII